MTGTQKRNKQFPWSWDGLQELPMVRFKQSEERHSSWGDYKSEQENQIKKADMQKFPCGEPEIRIPFDRAADKNLQVGELRPSKNQSCLKGECKK